MLIWKNKFKSFKELIGGNLSNNLLILDFVGDSWRIPCKNPKGVLQSIIAAKEEWIIDVEDCVARIQSMEQAANIIAESLEKVDKLPDNKVGKEDIDVEELPKITKKPAKKARKSKKKED